MRQSSSSFGHHLVAVRLRHSDEGNVDLKEILDLIDLAPIRHKQNDVIVGRNYGVMVRHEPSPRLRDERVPAGSQ